MPPVLLNRMMDTGQILLILKYVIGVLIIIAIFFAPAWLARQTKKGKPKMHYVRLASWVFGWSIIGWLWSLFCATKK